MNEYESNNYRSMDGITCSCLNSSISYQDSLLHHINQTPYPHTFFKSPSLSLPITSPTKLNLSKPHQSTSKLLNYSKLHKRRFIYIPQLNSFRLHKYNYILNKCTSYDLTAYISHKFYYTSICSISNESFLILGFRDSSTPYIYNSLKNSCIKLPSILYPRYKVSLIYTASKAYAFGGTIGYSTSNLAETFDFTKNRWVKLPSMLTARRCASCISIDNKIYIIAGDVNSIEQYDIKYSRYSIISIFTDSCYVLSFVRNNSIFIISEKKLVVYNAQWQIKQEIENAWNKSCYSLSNVSIQGSNVVFYNGSWDDIEEFKAMEKYRTKRCSVLCYTS